jgi:hypothetical protein
VLLRARLSFNFLDCPACNVRIDPDKTPYLKDMMAPHLKIEQEVKRKATQRLRESAAIVELQKGGKVHADEDERVSSSGSQPSLHDRATVDALTRYPHADVTTCFSAVKPNVGNAEKVYTMIIEMTVRKTTMRTS